MLKSIMLFRLYSVRNNMNILVHSYYRKTWPSLWHSRVKINEYQGSKTSWYSLQIIIPDTNNLNSVFTFVKYTKYIYEYYCKNVLMGTLIDLKINYFKSGRKHLDSRGILDARFSCLFYYTIRNATSLDLSICTSRTAPVETIGT